jgi:hypothetical protein
MISTSMPVPAIPLNREHLLACSAWAESGGRARISPSRRQELQSCAGLLQPAVWYSARAPAVNKRCLPDLFVAKSCLGLAQLFVTCAVFNILDLLSSFRQWLRPVAVLTHGKCEGRKDTSVLDHRP